MRFGFKTSPQDTTWDAMLGVWRAADQVELFESGWTSDHFCAVHQADLAGPRLEGWMTLAALAQATRRLRLGTLVTGVHYRPPTVLAQMAASVNVISGGRLELGLGAGWNAEESSVYGVSLGSARQRSDRLEEACELITELLAPPPICIGGSGEKRTLRTAARFAQHWNFDTGTVEQFSRARDVLHRHCAELGRDPAEILLSCQVRFTGDPYLTAENAAAFGAAGAGLAIVYLSPPYSPAVLEPLAAALSGLA